MARQSLQGGIGRYLFMRVPQEPLTAAQFEHLDLRDREALVLRQGVFIAIRQEPEFVIRLYQLPAFYAELYFHQLRKDPVSIRSFSHARGLDAYVRVMEVE